MALEASPLLRKGFLSRYTKEDVKKWLGDQASLLEGAPLDLVEVWVGRGALSEAVNRRGGRAIRIGLKYGHDLRRLRDRELLMALLHWWPQEMSG